jgi:Ca-activated chloride channel family protein
LITEDDILSQEGRDRAAANAAGTIAAAPSSGAVAVDQAQEVQALADAAMMPAPTATITTESGETINTADVLRYAGDRTFVLRDGVWTDTAFDPDTMTPVEVAFASDEYFALLSEHPELGAAFALGQQVIVVVGESAYQVTSTA